MNIQEAKKIRLVDFLGGLGHHPVIQRGNSVWYKSPFRMEKEASFKIDLRKELWYDFGLGKGGDIITLAKEIYQTNDISLVLRYIEDKKAVLKPVTISCPVEEAAPAFQELKIRPLANRILLAYLKERCIDVETARKNMPGDFLQAERKKIILPLPFPIFPVDMRCGTDFLRLVSLPRILLASRMDRKWAGVMCSRDLWTICLLSRPFLFGRRGLLGAELRQQLAEGFFLSFTI